MATVKSIPFPSYSNWSIEQLPGLSLQQQNLLKEAGIDTTGKLLKSAATHQLQQKLAIKLQLNPSYLKKWVAMAQLACIPSVGCQYCGLILHAGIASIAQLAQTPVPRLHRQILRLQVANLQRRDLCPSMDQVQIWIQQAKILTRQ